VDATTAPTMETTVEATSEATTEATSEATSEATMEATSEVTASVGATSVPAATTAPTATATNAPTGNTQPSNGLVVCDSDLILNLYIAEHFFGFDGVMAAVASNANPPAMVDLTKLDKGQFAALFVAPIKSVPSTVMTQDQMQAAAQLMVMDTATMMNQMATMMPPNTGVSSLTVLNSIAIPGEDPTCTNLRMELNRFNTIVAFQAIQNGVGTTASTTTTSGTGSTTSNMNFSTALSGANEVPPADPDGSGTAAVTVDMANTQICYTISVQNVALPATMAHIHRGAVGVKGDVVVPFSVVPDATGKATGCVKVDPALLQEIASNPSGFYVNVHTSEFPDGAVRGQVSG
jgi:hypothetical protein